MFSEKQFIKKILKTILSSILINEEEKKLNNNFSIDR